VLTWFRGIEDRCEAQESAGDVRPRPVIPGRFTASRLSREKIIAYYEDFMGGLRNTVLDRADNARVAISLSGDAIARPVAP
jgi:hypothetical protein